MVRVERRGQNLRFAIRAQLKPEPGASLSVDGVCLTVVDIAEETFWVEAIEPTINSTTLKGYRVGRCVNLEPALTLESPLGGHLMTGHVDGVGRLEKIVPHPGYAELWVRAGPEAKGLLLPRASIGVDGISLTISRVQGCEFSTHITPYTLEHTNIGRKRVGELVNLEFDYIAKWLRWPR